MSRATHAGAFRVRFVSGLTVLYTAFVLLVTLWPTTVDKDLSPYLESALSRLHDHGVPAFVNYGFIEFSANILFFVPVGFFASLVFTRRLWWLGALLGLLLSCGVEAAQALLLPGRVASLRDVLANTAGAVLGAVIAGLVRLVVMHRDSLVSRDVLEGRRDEDGTRIRDAHQERAEPLPTPYRP